MDAPGLSLTQLVELYFPLVGLLCLAFWTGMLSQRVRTNEREIKELKADGANAGTVRDRLTRIETLMEGVEDRLDAFGRGMEGMQRQLGNLTGKNMGSIVELDGGHRG